MARKGQTRLGTEWQGEAGMERLGTAELGKAWRGTAGPARIGKARHRMERPTTEQQRKGF